MHEIRFGRSGISDKALGGGIGRTEDLDVVGLFDVHQLDEPELIGKYLHALDKESIIDRWVFYDTHSIDVIVKQLNTIKDMMIRDKTMYEGEVGENE